MKCPECQADNPGGSEFCSLCYARFQVALRSQDTEEKARLMRESGPGSRLRCPNCSEISPLESQFCLRCGFVFEELESLLVTEEELACMSEAAAEACGAEDLLAPPVEIAPGADGADVMRRLSQEMNRGLKPRMYAHGRDAVTHAMKIAALLSEELRAQGTELRLRASLISKGAVTHLDDVELEITLEGC